MITSVNSLAGASVLRLFGVASPTQSQSPPVSTAATASVTPTRVAGGTLQAILQAGETSDLAAATGNSPNSASSAPDAYTLAQFTAAFYGSKDDNTALSGNNLNYNGAVRSGYGAQDYADYLQAVASKTVKIIPAGDVAGLNYRVDKWTMRNGQGDVIGGGEGVYSSATPALGNRYLITDKSFVIEW
jgi:hypothetical protein